MFLFAVGDQAAVVAFLPVSFGVPNVVVVLFVFSLVVGGELAGNLRFLGRTSVFFRINAEFLVEMGELVDSVRKFHFCSMIEDLGGSLHVESVGGFVVFYDFF